MVGVTELEPTLTSLRKLAENHLSFGQYKAAQMLQDAADVIEGLESENASLRGAVEGFCDQNTKLRELCKELLDLCYDAYEQKWGWDDDWALAYERAKKLGVEP